jgi:hypothetical protein
LHLFCFQKGFGKDIHEAGKVSSIRFYYRYGLHIQSALRAVIPGRRWRWRPLLSRPEFALDVLAGSGFRSLQRLIAVSKWRVLEVDWRLQRLLLQLVERTEHCGDAAARIIAACIGQAVEFLLRQKI